jgi:hypothetical protein
LLRWERRWSSRGLGPGDYGVCRDHHAAGCLAHDREDLGWEGLAEAAPRFDRGADDNQLGAVVVRHLGEFESERAFSGADDASFDAYAVRVGDCGRTVEALA